MPRCALVQDPAVLAIVAPETVFDAEALTLDKALTEPLQARVPVIGVDRLRPAIAQLVFHVPAGELQPATVEPVALHGRVAGPEQRRRCVGHRVEVVEHLPPLLLQSPPLVHLALQPMHRPVQLPAAQGQRQRQCQGGQTDGRQPSVPFGQHHVGGHTVHHDHLRGGAGQATEGHPPLDAIELTAGQEAAGRPAGDHLGHMAFDGLSDLLFVKGGPCKDRHHAAGYDAEQGHAAAILDAIVLQPGQHRREREIHDVAGHGLSIRTSLPDQGNGPYQRGAVHGTDMPATGDGFGHLRKFFGCRLWFQQPITDQFNDLAA